LRVLEDQLIRPVGSTKALKVDLRLIAATNRDLENAVKEAGFREDLFYRINTITLRIPALRERKEDISLLVDHFLSRYSKELGKNITEISDEALSRMINYQWPGNVRELQNVIERAILIAENSKIKVENLPEAMRGGGTFPETSLAKQLSIEDYTKAFIRKYQSDHNEQQLASMLGMTRKSLWEKRKKWGMSKA
jgi:two-component system response regulator PilR (NtrC family)